MKNKDLSIDFIISGDISGGFLYIDQKTMISSASTMRNAISDDFFQIFLQRHEQHSNRVAYCFFHGSDGGSKSLTFHELWQQSTALAGMLQERGLAGRCVVIACISQQQFVTAFFAILLAGAIAVPASVPRRRAAVMERFELLVQDAKVAAILHDCNDIDSIDIRVDGTDVFKVDLRKWITGDDHRQYGKNWRHPDVNADSIAFLQYTSGSTGDPKGVVVLHRNLIANCEAIANAMGITEDDRILTTLPLFHDMGLIGGVLQSMFSGCRSHFLSPSESVQYPERWLEIITKHRITISGGPNFIYDLAVKGITEEKIAGIDLSAWRIAFSGAEPIRVSVINAFIERFAPCGFHAGAFYPCYGMAESTLFVTGRLPHSLFKIAQFNQVDIVGCGVPFDDTRITIVDPESSLPLENGICGEIWVSGSSVAAGYWLRPQLSQQVFQARLAGDPAAYLRTGDLGYVRDGELYVTGRLKDLIILNGRKFAPQDLEEIGQDAHPALGSGGGAAFSVLFDGAERLVLVFELNREWLRRHEEWHQIEAAVRHAIHHVLGVPIHALAWLKPGALPRTSSGKVRRSQCKEDYLANVLTLAL